MTHDLIIRKALFSQVIRERMMLESIIILATVERIQYMIEQKLLEIDSLEDDYTFEQVAKLRIEVLELLGKLRREERQMDLFMSKYKRLSDEKEAMLPYSSKKKQVYLRGVPTYTRR